MLHQAARRVDDSPATRTSRVAAEYECENIGWHPDPCLPNLNRVGHVRIVQSLALAFFCTAHPEKSPTYTSVRTLRGDRFARSAVLRKAAAAQEVHECALDEKNLKLVML